MTEKWCFGFFFQKEKERLGQKNSDSPQKPSALCNMGVEELMQFINGGCEGNENGKESRSSSRAASKKSKRQKKVIVLLLVHVSIRS